MRPQACELEARVGKTEVIVHESIVDTEGVQFIDTGDSLLVVILDRRHGQRMIRNGAGRY